MATRVGPVGDVADGSGGTFEADFGLEAGAPASAPFGAFATHSPSAVHDAAAPQGGLHLLTHCPRLHINPVLQAGTHSLSIFDTSCIAESAEL
jgi:hypothetical protein